MSKSRLIIQLARLGDFLQTTPLLKALADDGPISVVLPSALEVLARRSNLAAEIIPLELGQAAAIKSKNRSRAEVVDALERAWSPLWRREFAEVYNLNLGRITTLLAASFPDATQMAWHLADDHKTHIGAPWTRFMMQMVARRRLTRHHLSDILASYADPAAPPADGLIYEVQPGDLERVEGMLPAHSPLVVLQLGANHDNRRWPIDLFAALARGLMQEGVAIALTGAKTEKTLAARFKAHLGKEAAQVSDLMGRTDLAQLGAVINQADLVIGCDTGTLHFATAVGAKVMGLYMGPAQAYETGPYGRHLHFQARDECGPCLEDKPSCGGKAPCRRLLQPEMVLSAVRHLLAGGRPDQVWPGLELPPGLMAYSGGMDGFGQIYLPLMPVPIGVEDALAFGLREAGRVLMRGRYTPDLAVLNAELGKCYSGAASGEAAGLEALSQAARRLTGAIAAGDLGVLGQLSNAAPGLRPLIAVATDGNDTPRLAEAAAICSKCLELTLNL